MPEQEEGQHYFRYKLTLVRHGFVAAPSANEALITALNRETARIPGLKRSEWTKTQVSAMRPVVSDLDESDDLAIVSQLLDQIDDNRLQAAFDQVPPVQRHVLHLSYSLGALATDPPLSSIAIAARIPGLNPGDVRRLRAEGLRSLLSILRASQPETSDASEA